MDLEALKRKFERELGLGEYNLSDEEIIQIYEQIKDIRPKDRTENILQKAISEVTGVDSFMIADAVLDDSDIDHIIGQIRDALKDSKK